MKQLPDCDLGLLHEEDWVFHPDHQRGQEIQEAGLAKSTGWAGGRGEEMENQMLPMNAHPVNVKDQKEAHDWDLGMTFCPLCSSCSCYSM